MSIIYPSCPKCEGLINIRFNNNLYLDFYCDKNENHKGEKIFFPTFAKFYLKEKNVRCSKCNNNLFNKYIYEVEYKKNKEKKEGEKEDKIFCINCFQEEFENIKFDDVHLNIKNNKCKLHDYNLNHYCIDCKKNICIFCIKEDEMNVHKNHNIENLENFIPTSEEIKDFQNKIKQKSKVYKELKNKINIWKNKIITKTEQLIQNLENEIIILEKIIFNFNNKFMNYTYYNNFHYLKNFVKNINNEYLIKFNDNPDFRNQCINLIDLFTLFYPKRPTTKLLKTNIKDYYDLNYAIPEKINKYYFLDKTDNSIVHYNKNKDEFTSCWYLNDFKEKIYTISLSLDKRIIYACLTNKKIVKFFYFNGKEFYMKNQEIIDYENINSHFNKCIQLTNLYLATADDNNIKIWNNNNSNQLEIEKKIIIGTKTSDLILVNNEYFISSQPDKKIIIIININTFEISNTILNVDCTDSQNSLLSLKNFIIINCIKGIQLFFKKTREITQNIQIFDNELENKELYVYNNILYILQQHKVNSYLSNLKLSIFEFYDGFLEKIQEYEKTEIEDYNLKIIVMNEEQILLVGKYLYILK